jgi:type II secretory pathway predicted ATPase ExeA
MGKDIAMLRKLSTEERKILVERVYVKHPHSENLLKKIDYCRTHSKISAEPDGMLITGQQGMGKSTLWKRYVKDFPRTKTETGMIIPVLTVGIKAPATPKSLVTVLLSALGDPAAERGANVTQTLRLYRYLERCQTELIILDEFQHFIDRDLSKVLKTISDWLKMLMNDTGLPIVLIGMPNSVRVLDAHGNEQLKRRFSVRESLQPFAWSVSGDLSIVKFLKKLDDLLPLIESSNLADQDTAYRIYCATNGEMYRMMDLVRMATTLALDDGVERICMRLLFKAYEACPALDELDAGNPFEEGSTPKPLAKKATKTNAGEDVEATNRRVKSGKYEVPLSSVLVK